MHELGLAWRLLPSSGGVLIGDDWGWPGVHADLLSFAACLGSAGPQALSASSAPSAPPVSSAPSAPSAPSTLTAPSTCPAPRHLGTSAPRHLGTSAPRQAAAHATEIGRLLGEEGLQQECREQPTPAALLRRVKQHWDRHHVNTGRFCVRGSHEILMFGVGQWVLIKTPQSKTPATCASLTSLEPS